MNFGKGIALSLTAMLGLFGVAGQAQSRNADGLVKDGTLIYCTSRTEPPYIFVEGTETKGVLYDHVVGLAKTMELTPELVDLSFDGLIAAVKTGKCDIATGGHSITEKRLEEVAMIPYFVNGAQFITRKGNPSGLAIPADYAPARPFPLPTDDICGRRIAAVLGTTEADDNQRWSEECVAAGKPAIDSVLADSITNLFQFVATGQADAANLASLVAAYQASRQPDLLELNGPIFGATPAGIIVAKDNATLAENIRKALLKMRADGETVTIFNQWMPNGAELDALIPYEQ